MAMAAPLSWRDDMDDGKRLRTGPSVGALTGQAHMSRGPVCRCMCVGFPSAGRGGRGCRARASEALLVFSSTDLPKLGRTLGSDPACES